MSTWALAFFIGLFGSIHCVGMCGPLAFAVPSFHSGRWLVFSDKLVYQIGRVISYTVLGVLTGFIGKQLWLSGLQQSVSVVSGVFIIMAACSRLFKRTIAVNASSVMLVPFNRLFNYALKHRANHLIIGMVNGLLPCGFVYLALAGAVTTGNIADAASYMFWFGIGTLPLMLAVTFGIGLVTPVFRRKINQFMPVLMLCLGIWFVMKGLTLNIPYLSPAGPEGTVICK